MHKLHDGVQAGLVCYIGMFSCYAWQCNYAIANKLTASISIQKHYNLLYRDEEREILPTLKVPLLTHPLAAYSFQPCAHSFFFFVPPSPGSPSHAAPSPAHSLSNITSWQRIRPLVDYALQLDQ
ncbi:hypothetical protein B0H14DRAFT_2336040 [Mycena olivaceomarginata]|nr:hypothetical protein B0H14DRAFT_2336040 [Mycena olivaceomarginata]